MPKRKIGENAGCGDVPLESTEENSGPSTGLKNTLHGNVFQLKLLMLFLIRGIDAGYQFKLGTEVPGQGGKFDDLIFKYKIDTSGEDNKRWRYRYLQAKHKQDDVEDKITATLLLNDNDGDYSLPKYFRSYRRDIISKTDGTDFLDDCVICTNIGFGDIDILKQNGVEFEPVSSCDNILDFQNDLELLQVQATYSQPSPSNVQAQSKCPSRFKLKRTDLLVEKMKEWSDIHLLAKTLLDYAVVSKKQLNLGVKIFKIYHVTLVKENVIEAKIATVKFTGEGKLNDDFVAGRIELAKSNLIEFRNILSEITFLHYWSKLKFSAPAISSPKKTKIDDNASGGITTTNDANNLDDITSSYILDNLPCYSGTQVMSISFDMFEKYREDMKQENIMEDATESKKNTKFSKQFIKGENLSEKAQRFRNKLRDSVFIRCWKSLRFQLSATVGKNKAGTENKSLDDFVSDDDINGFLEKFVLAMDTPNEVQLGRILTKEVGQRYNLRESDFQSAYILNIMLDWFKLKESPWCSSEDGEALLRDAAQKMESLRVTAVSIDYQGRLLESLQFNGKAIGEWVKNMKPFLDSPSAKVERINTPSPKHTVVKIIAALKAGGSDFKKDDSCLVIESKRAQGQVEREHLEKILKLKKDPYVLVVVCEDASSFIQENYFYSSLSNGKVIIISGAGNSGLKDDISFNDLSDQCQRKLLSITVEFQETETTVGDLIRKKDETLDELVRNGRAEKVIDSFTMMKLIEGEKITIPSQSTSTFEQSLYIKRRLALPCPSQVELIREEMARQLGQPKVRKEFQVDLHGKIHWFVQDDERKSNIWKQLMEILEKRYSAAAPPTDALNEDELICYKRDDWGRRAVIISGVAGTGKSTLLSYFYHQIKIEKPDDWVIKLNLVDHFVDLMDFYYTGGSVNVADFFAKLPQVALNSQFAQSLLRHRLETGDRIVIMLDGFDEIDGRCQEWAIRVMKGIVNNNHQSESVRLYVTTRPHVANHLQFQLSQLSYNLENFSSKDQIGCLVSFWKRHTITNNDTTSQTARTIKDLKTFAEWLVERVTATLKDDCEKSFVGIPLQCRILAECFLPEIQSALSENRQIGYKRLSETVEAENFDLLSLYRLFMDTKRQVFRGEKIKAPTTNHIVNYSIDVVINQTESHLRKLAIETILSNPKYVEMLQPSFNQHQPDLCAERNDKQFNELGIRFGLLNKIRGEDDQQDDGLKVEFLHRTYAEYLVADYLYQGFLIDEAKHNKLLDGESVCKLIVKKILVKSQYDGVRVFLDSMIKEMVNSDEWRQIIERHQLPHRLQRLADWLVESGQQTRSSTFCQWGLFNVRQVAMFKFWCDCLDATYDKRKVRQVIASLFVHTNQFYYGRSEVFQRCIQYFTDLMDDNVKPVLEGICKLLPPHILHLSDWNKDEPKKMVGIILDFMVHHRETLKSLIESHLLTEAEASTFGNLKRFIWFFIFNEYNDDRHLERLIELLHWVFTNNDSAFSDLLAESIAPTFKESWSIGRIEKTLILLRNRGCTNALTALSHLVLIKEPTVFERFYIIEAEEDAYQLTRLHRALFNNDVNTVHELLENVGLQQLSQQSLTAFYMAAACGHQELCSDMLLTLISDDEETDEYLTSGFVHSALWDAIRFNAVSMFRHILEAVSRVFGQNSLLDLLESVKHLNREENSAFVECANNKVLFDILIEIVVKSDTEKGYAYINQLVFRDEKTLKTLRNIDTSTLQGMISSLSLEVLIQQILSKPNGFLLISHYLLEKLEKHQLEQFVDIITHCPKADEDGKGQFPVSSFWCDFVESYQSNEILRPFRLLVDVIDKVLACISKRLGDPVVKRLLLHNDGNGSFIVRTSLWVGQETANTILGRLPKEHQTEVQQEFKKQAPQIITDIFFSVSSCYWTKLNKLNGLNALLFYLDHANDDQLSKFVQLVTYPNVDEKKEIIVVWDNIFNKFNNNEQEIDKFLSRIKSKLGDNAVNELVFHEDSKGLIIARKSLIDEENIAVIYSHLSTENQGKLRRKLFTNEKVITFHYSSIQVDGVTKWAKHHLGIGNDSTGAVNTLFEAVNVLHSLSEFGAPEMCQFVDLITAVKKRDRKAWSIWSDYIDKTIAGGGTTTTTESHKTVGEFLKSVSETLGEDYVKKLVLHNVGNDDVIVRAASNAQLVETMLTHFRDENIRRNIGEKVFNRYVVIENLLISKGWRHLVDRYLGINDAGLATNVLGGFQLLARYFVEKFDATQLKQFIEFVMCLNNDRPIGTRGHSIWGDFANEISSLTVKQSKELQNDLEKLVKCVSRHLGRQVMKELLLHESDRGIVIKHFATYLDDSMVDSIIVNHLNEEDRDEIRHHCESARKGFKIRLKF